MEQKKSKRESAEERLRRVYRQRLMVGAVCVLVFFYLCGVFWHLFHFQKKTYINGINVGGKSVRAAAKAFEAEAKDYELRVVDLNGNASVLKDASLDLAVSGNGGLRAALRHQSALNWVLGSFVKKEYSADVETTYNQAVVEAYLDSLEALNSETMTPPVDAALVKGGDGFVSIQSEQEGTELDIAAAKQGIRDAVGGYHPEVQLSDYQVHPVIYRNDEALQRRMKEWNDYLKASGLSFNMPSGRVTLDSSTIASLLRDTGDEVKVSYDLVADLMANWKASYDTYANKFEYHTAEGNDVTIMPWGDYGYQLDEEGTAKALIQYIKDGDTGNHEASWFHTGNDMSNMGLGGNYVEVSIDEQHLWVYQDGEIVLDTEVVTGNPNPDEKGKNRQTYLGCYAIKDKMKDVTLGTLDVQGYESPVKYWVPFNGGEGLHDAPWREEFGGKIYQYNGSHGCVNCPPEVMGSIYKYVKKGDAVVVY